MTRKKPEKRITLLEPAFNEILVCQKKDFRPYLEVIIQKGENVSQENLGMLLGILEITDESEDSSYVVNYLISIIKKEYFSKGKRGAIESFESALHRANLALSKLAQHENINWIGKLNALIAVIEKNNLHFSQAGKASAMLLRNGILTDISEGMSEEASLNPLKTFTNLSSGKMEEGDKLILATPEIFDIFSLEEIKKSALRFSNVNFAQFLKTALGNELEKTAALVADIQKKELPKENISSAKSSDYELNAFSQKTFIPKAGNKEKREEKGEKEKIINELEEALEKESPNDGKYGHIYIKEGFELQEEKKFNKNKFIITNALGDFWKKTKDNASKEKFKKSLNHLKLEIQKKEVGKNIWQFIISLGKNAFYLAKIIFSKISLVFSSFFNKTPAKETIAQYPSFKKIWPSFSEIIQKFKSFNQKQRIYALIIFLLIFIVPIFIAKEINTIQNKAAEKSLPKKTPSVAHQISESNSNIFQAENVSTVFLGKNIQGIINLNNSFFAIASNSLVQLSNQKVWSMPENFGEIAKFTAMPDLNLIFLANKENKFLSFSPISQKFQENLLNLPENTRIQAMGTFMTYLYILDAKNNQIYRYPRAEGGFGEKTNWLKAAADLSKNENMSLTDSVYLWGKEDFAKFFRGKKEVLTLENFSSPENIRALYADENSLYILDKNEGMIKKFGLDGKFIFQISSDKIKTAESLAVSNDEKTFYIASPEEVISFSISVGL